MYGTAVMMAVSLGATLFKIGLGLQLRCKRMGYRRNEQKKLQDKREKR